MRLAKFCLKTEQAIMSKAYLSGIGGYYEPRPSNPTALELAIHRFEQLANQHYQNGKQSMDAKAKQKHARDLQHLQRERIRISTQAALQQDLDTYRKENKQKSVVELAKEPHHPTNVLSKNLTAIAEPKPSQDHDAHHIVMGKGRWLKSEMMRARLSLHLHGIGVNDPINGVWLPRDRESKGHWATPNSPAHKEIHRYNYERWVSNKLGAPALPESSVRNRLRDIKHVLTYGGYPSQIVGKKDAQWVGE